MRHAEVWTKTDHPIGKMDVSGEQSTGQREDLVLHRFTVVLDLPVHGASIASLLYLGNPAISRKRRAVRRARHRMDSDTVTGTPLMLTRVRSN